MAINDMTIEQSSAVLNALVLQATGRNPTLDTTNPKNFVTVAQTLLKTGYDPVLTAISQVLSRTIFSVRPYTAKFRGLEVSAQRWGNHVRKVNYLDQSFEDDDRLPLTDGSSVDPWIIKKPSVIQTNFYGEHVFQRHTTIFKDQLDVAMSSASEFGSFVSGQLSNINDQIEQANEEFDRATIANFIVGKVSKDSASVIHLVTEYNDYIGGEYTSETIREPDVYREFVKWVYARIKNLIGLLAERSVKWHILPLKNNAPAALMRHSPANRLKMYTYSPVMNEITARVLSEIYHDDKLSMIDHEEVTYWQNIDVPGSIKADANVFDPTTGGIVTTGETTVNNIFGVIFDEEAIGVTNVNQWAQSTPMNARGGYSNTFWHWTRRHWNDFTENGVVLLLD